MTKHDDHERLRAQVAQEAARIISEQGIRDFGQAKRKAGARLNIRGRAALPSNAEIEKALVAHQTLFGREAHEDHVARLRQHAAAAMEFLAPFAPRLVGPVANGTAGEGAVVGLHVFADTPEDVLFTLEAGELSVRSFQRRYRSNGDIVAEQPGYAFRWEDSDIEATVFPVDGQRQAPPSPVDGKPMRRVSLSELEALLSPAASDDVADVPGDYR